MSPPTSPPWDSVDSSESGPESHLLEKARVRHITFHNPENGYSVVRLSHPRARGDFTAVGHFPRLSPGEEVDLEGEWTRHPTFGDQFKARSCTVRPPDTGAALEKYLGGGLFKGIGPASAKAIVERFGLDTIRILDQEPQRLQELSQFKGRKAEALMQQWDEHRSMREVLFFLQTHNLSLGLCARICRQLGPDAARMLKSDPYRLAVDMPGIPFAQVDAIGRKLGFEDDCFERVRGGLLHALQKAAEDGHVYLSHEELMARAGTLLRSREETLVYTLDHLRDNEEIHADEQGLLYLPYLFFSEKGIARKLRELSFSPKALAETSVKRAVKSAEAACAPGFVYSPEQRIGIGEAANRGVFLLTGGPGTGKTTTVLGILRVFQEGGLNIKLAAPTGRAAKRLSEITGHPASTLHRLLKYEVGSGAFAHNENFPLDADALIVDELSMIDTVLMYSLLKAVRGGTRLVLIGDPDQLPSVGPGKVLAELISGNQIPHLHLSKIFRQAESSQIVLNAHRINRGETPVATEEGNFHILARSEIQDCLTAVEELAGTLLSGNIRFDSRSELQVLTPMNQGPLGTIVLNQRLQALLNPHGSPLRHRDREFRDGDKVMQIRNNYDKNIFNGDIGFIVAVSAKTRSLSVQYDDQLVAYEGEELDQLNPAYAVTVHKSQGSEFGSVILVLTRSHHMMLQRNLFYTAVTRARKHLFLVGDPTAISRAVANNPTVNRNTRLSARIEAEMRLQMEIPGRDWEPHAPSTFRGGNFNGIFDSGQD